MSNGITKEMIDRINVLAAKKKTVGLNEEETLEQKALYKDYLAAIRGQVRASLSQVKFVEDMTEEEIEIEITKKNS